MNAAILKNLMQRKQQIADQNAERDARASRRVQLRENQPMARWRANIANEQARALNLINERAALVARTTIDPSSVPAVPKIAPPKRPIPEFKNGGLVRVTGLAKVHKGELVVPATRVASVKKAVQKAGLKPLRV
jgi:hypothetical protein